jgi:Fe-S-cluster containining protein
MTEGTLTQEQILNSIPRLSLDDVFTFRCGNDLDCFTNCCANVSIVLTPYDVLRMKRALKMDSSDFLDTYTISPFTVDQKIPAVLIKMDAETKKCPFLTEQGCGIYADRPWACRMYPLGIAAPKNPNPQDHDFHFLIKEPLCHGHGEGRQFTVREFLAEQGVEEYDMMGAPFRDLMLHDFWEKGDPLEPRKMDMFMMACYDLDRFRRFVFESRFLEMFEVDEARVEALRTDDLELLDFGMQWLRFVLFQEKTMRLRRSVVEARQTKS